MLHFATIHKNESVEDLTWGLLVFMKKKSIQSLNGRTLCWVSDFKNSEASIEDLWSQGGT